MEEITIYIFNILNSKKILQQEYWKSVNTCLMSNIKSRWLIIQTILMYNILNPLELDIFYSNIHTFICSLPTNYYKQRENIILRFLNLQKILKKCFLSGYDMYRRIFSRHNRMLPVAKGVNTEYFKNEKKQKTSS